MDWRLNRKMKALRYGLIRYENSKKTASDLKKVIQRANCLAKTKLKGVK